MTLLVLMGIKKEDPSKIRYLVAVGVKPVQGESSNLVASVEEDYGSPYKAGEELALKLMRSGVSGASFLYHNGWNANGVYSPAEPITDFDADRFKRGFVSTLVRSLDRRA